MTHRLRTVASAILSGVTLVSLASFAADAPKPAKKPAAATKPAAAKKPAGPKATPRHQLIDHGPFVTATIPTQWPEGGIVNKAVAVRLTGERGTAAGILFDTDACRVAAGWTGGFVEFTKDWTSVRDSKSVKLVGTQSFGTVPGPGWAKPGVADDDPAAWKDPRPDGFGPLPADWVKYRGLYRLPDGRVAVSYAVGGCEVKETFALTSDRPISGTIVETPGVAAWTSSYVRTIELAACDRPLTLAVLDRADATAATDGTSHATLSVPEAAGESALVGVRGHSVPAGSRWAVSNDGGRGRVMFRVAAHAAPCTFTVFIGTAPQKAVAERSKRIDPKALPVAPPNDKPDVRPLTAACAAGSPTAWPQVLTTSGTLGRPKPDAPYAVDTITLPDDNPWHSWMRPGGFDFFTSDPTKAAICNWSGDVWVVSGITGDLKELKWKRFASGLFQPLGLKIVNDVIYVHGRDQVTKLVDLNGDGEADFYECFNNDVQVTPNFHEFAFDLQTDKAGNFYFAKAGPVRNGGRGFEAIARDHGAILKLSPDGKKLETVATGFRAPNGIGVSPDGQLTAGDNEGSWVPKCRIAWVRPGGFYGVVPTSHRDPPPADYDRPLCWMPKDVDNSSGGQVWVTGDKWGPFQGRLLHLSYGTCSLFLVSKQDLEGCKVQGGVIRFPLAFDSGIMRARFNPADGQLYVAGLKGWQTSAGKDGCFHRVRYTGKPVHMPTDVAATKGGLRITFSSPLNKEDANAPASFAVERWNYNWSEAYGSPDVSVADPKRSGHDPVKVKSATLSADGRSVFLEIPDMRPAMQYKTDVNLTTADGVDVRFAIIHTVHELP